MVKANVCVCVLEGCPGVHRLVAECAAFHCRCGWVWSIWVLQLVAQFVVVSQGVWLDSVGVVCVSVFPGMPHCGVHSLR